MKIDINKKYRYRCGDEARILCVDLVGPNDDGRPQPVASYGGCGEEVLFHFEDGVFDKPDSDDPFDLIEVREPREWKAEGYSASRRLLAITDGPPIATGEQIRVREIID